MNYTFKRCGHENDELNLICNDCGRFFIKWPFIPLIVSILSIVLVYYFSDSYLNSFILYFDIVVIVFIISILRRKVAQLWYILLIIPSSFYLSIISNENVRNNLNQVEGIVFKAIALSLLIIAMLISIYFGINDAVVYQNLNKGSFWVIISLLLSLLFTLVYYLIPLFFKENIFESNTYLAKQVLYYLKIVYQIRFFIVASIFVVTILVSTAIAFKRKLNTSMFSDPIRKSFHMITQFVAILANEVYKTFKFTLIRLMLILFRLVKFAIITSFTILLSYFLFFLSNYLNLLINTYEFWGLSFVDYLILIFLIILSFLVTMLITVASYSKQSFTHTNILSILTQVLFIEWDRFKNLFVSTLYYTFFITLSFLFAWLIITLLYFIFDINRPSPVGFLSTIYFVTLTLVAILYNYRNRQNLNNANP